jgi:hypothetical protein
VIDDFGSYYFLTSIGLAKEVTVDLTIFYSLSDMKILLFLAKDLVGDITTESLFVMSIT